MQLYDVKIRLAGLANNEVRKSDVTAAEVMVLRAIHGADAVGDIVATKMDKRTHGEERSRLNNQYTNQFSSSPEMYAKRLAMMRGLFGADTAALPVKLDEDIPTKGQTRKADALA